MQTHCQMLLLLSSLINKANILLFAQRIRRALMQYTCTQATTTIITATTIKAAWTVIKFTHCHALRFRFLFSVFCTVRFANFLTNSVGENICMHKCCTRTCRGMPQIRYGFFCQFQNVYCDFLYPSRSKNW